MLPHDDLWKSYPNFAWFLFPICLSWKINIIEDKITNFKFWGMWPHLLSPYLALVHIYIYIYMRASECIWVWVSAHQHVWVLVSAHEYMRVWVRAREWVWVHVRPRWVSACECECNVSVSAMWMRVWVQAQHWQLE